MRIHLVLNSVKHKHTLYGFYAILSTITAIHKYNLYVQTHIRFIF